VLVLEDDNETGYVLLVVVDEGCDCSAFVLALGARMLGCSTATMS